jgi:hypothetical protein
MATNEILPFATTNTGTNLLTQAEYAADAQRPIGHQPGIARSKLANKAMRQASLLAAGLAQFLADKQTTNVTDSLTKEQIAEMLVNAIAANFLARNGGNTMTGMLRGKSGSASPNNTNNNGFVFDNDNDTGLFNPADNQLEIAVNGVRHMFMQGSTATSSTKQFRVPAGAPNNLNASDNAGFAFAQSGDTGLFWEDSDGVSGGTLRLRMDNGIVAAWNQSMRSMGNNGWYRTAEGVIFQWCEVSYVNMGGIGSVVGFSRFFPIAFPSACLSVNVSASGSLDDGIEHVMGANWDRLGFSGSAKRVIGSPTGDTVNVRALAVGF